MHVSHHFRPLPLQVNASAHLRTTRKKPADPDKVPPVKGRFSEEEPQKDRRQQRSWQSKPLQRPDEEVAAETAEVFEDSPSPQSSGAAVPAVQVASSQVTSPLDPLLAGIRGEAPTSSEPAASSEHHEAAAEASLEDLLALMRAAPQNP